MEGRGLALMCTQLRKCAAAHSSTDNFLSTVLVSDWLIFCCENLIVHQKKNENDKNKFFDEKQQDKKNAKKVDINRTLYCFL